MNVTFYRFFPLGCDIHWFAAERGRKRMVRFGGKGALEAGDR